MESVFYQELFSHFMACAWREAPAVARDEVICREIFHDRVLFPSRVKSVSEAERRLQGKGREFRSPAAYKNFLYTIFKNAIIDHLRERQRAKLREGPLEDRDGAEWAADPAPSARPELLAAARKIFLELSREERRLLTLRYVRNKTLVEMGQVLDLSKSTVDRREKLLIQKLFRLIDSEGGIMEEESGPVLGLVLDLIADKGSRP